MSIRVCALAVLFASVGPGVASAQDAVAPEDRLSSAAVAVVELSPELEARATALDGELKCPVCRSQSIRQSRSFMAEDMKRRVRELIAAGKNDDEIREYFVARYGEWILLTPPKSGFSLTAWALPLIAVVLGAVVLVWAARQRRGQEVEVAVKPLPKRYLERLDREIEETE